MPDLHVRIEFDPDSSGNQGKALAEIKQRDPDFLWPEKPWWHKPLWANPRSAVSRILSKHGCKGRISLEPHTGDGPYDQPPPPRWTGFTPKA